MKSLTQLPRGFSSLQGYFTASYADLKKVLGEPQSSDGYKVSTEWIVEHNGRTWTIYDYKETDLYEPGYPSVEQFRKLPEYQWHIGGEGKEGLNKFIKDLKALL